MKYALLIAIALTLGTAGRAQAQPGDRVEQTQVTTSYQVRLEIGPASPMGVVETAAGAPMVAVMLPHTGAAFGEAADQGLPVNHHLEIYLADAETGQILTELGPTVEIVNLATGEQRELTSVPMYEADEGLGDWHYGNNVYLPAGRYTVTADVAGERAVFENVLIEGE